MTVSRPTAADLAAARDRTIPDIIAPGLRVLFAGINPGLYSAATGQALRPTRQPVLARIAPVRVHPAPAAARSEQAQLLALGLGITNVAPRATARAAELSPAPNCWAGASGADRPRSPSSAPRWLTVVGVTAYRTAFGRVDAVVGPQPDSAIWGSTRLWVLPNPSGLNAHWSFGFSSLRRSAS